jgi:hypothetical protein
VLDLMNYGEHIPKLHVVTNYGDRSVLPEVVEMCNREMFPIVDNNPE